MNKTEIFFVILAISNIFFVLSSAEEEEKTKEERRYTTKYDNVDIDAIIKSERLLNAYVGCLLDRNPCTPDAMELKRNLPDALATDCSACSESQKNAADKLSHYLIDNRPDQWSLLEEKYDPDGNYKRNYKKDLRNQVDYFVAARFEVTGLGLRKISHIRMPVEDGTSVVTWVAGVLLGRSFTSFLEIEDLEYVFPPREERDEDPEFRSNPNSGNKMS